jgi:acyl-CoA dehydrogenase
MMPKVYNDIATKAAHLHGALGVSNEMPFMHMVTSSLVMGIADGPTEVHKVTVAKQVLKDYRPDNDLFPAYHIPKLREAAQEKYAKELAEMKAAYAERREKAPV